MKNTIPAPLNKGSNRTSTTPHCDDGICIMNDQSFIEATGVSIRYANRLVLSDVHFTANSCSITALIGPSGCGKSSFLACFNRLTDLSPNCRVEGRFRIGDQDLHDHHLDVLQLRKRVGMIFQQPNPFPLSIWKNLSLPLQQHGIRDRTQVAELIETALKDAALWDEVKDRLHSPALALSGGQQQRLCIARAIVLKPEVLLMDEPCSALDPIASRRIEELILSFRSRFTVLIVTHNLAQARRIADRTGVFWTRNGVGQMLEIGSTQQIFTSPSQPQTAAYISGQIG